jgi:riboflavin synthase
MFTGLVESTARVIALESRGEQARLTLELPFQAELALGDSVAVNGCCLTVAELGPAGTGFDLLMQTLAVTSLGALDAGSIVNVERAMAATARFGGHFVQGHVDATGVITALEPHGQDHRFEVSLPADIHRLCIDKGSLCVDGISLTIAELKDSGAVFWITPHTYAETHLHAARVGQEVNLEADLLAKYVDRLMLKR